MSTNRTIPRRLTISGSDPRGAQQLKTHLNNMSGAISSVSDLRGDGVTTAVRNGTVTANVFPYALVSFSCITKAGAKVHVNTGMFVIRGRLQITVPETATPLNLTGAMAHVYVEVEDADSTEATIGFDNLYDAKSVGTIRRYLARYEGIAAGQYRLRQIYHMGDVYEHAP